MNGANSQLWDYAESENTMVVRVATEHAHPYKNDMPN